MSAKQVEAVHGPPHPVLVASQIMCRAPRFFVLARVGTSATWNPACFSRRVKAGSGAEDQTEKIPPGVSARWAKASPWAE